jgi:mRNA interferase RelE/StbE
MCFAIELKPRAVKDLERLPRGNASRIADALERMRDGLAGDVKRLTHFTPSYRLRVGMFRILFEIEGQAKIVVYRIVHRREAYR